MTFEEIMQFLKDHGSEQTKKVLVRHGAREPFYGVRVSDLKVIQKKVKKDYDLSLKLYATGNTDAMYLAGLIADPELMCRKDLHTWVEGAYWYMISDYTIPTVTALSKHGLELAMEWIDSGKEFTESAGWSTLSAYLSYNILSTEEADMLKALLKRAKTSLQTSKNRVKYAMNGYIIACGAFHQAFTEEAFAVADYVGRVQVDMGGTSCKVPPARQTIEKVIAKGKHGVKRKS